MPEIIKDSDLPKLLDNPSKQVKWAKKLVAQHLGSVSKRVDKPPIQGMFSRTFFLTLADGREVAVQFRNEPLDLDAFTTAKRVLGGFVPDAQALPSEELQSANAWAYSMKRMPGNLWLRGVAGKGAGGRIAVNKSLGRVFSKGFFTNSSREAVETKLKPHVNSILASPLEDIAPWKPTVERLAARFDEFAQLPLWVAHHDINEVNVLVDDNCEVTALMDWELSSPLPFGFGWGRVHTMAGEYTGGEFWIPDEFEEAERGFWAELFGGMPDEIQKFLEDRMELVQDAVLLATLLNCFYLESGNVGAAPVPLKALPKMMTYRLPPIRGQDTAYRD